MKEPLPEPRSNGVFADGENKRPSRMASSLLGFRREKRDIPRGKTTVVSGEQSLLLGIETAAKQRETHPLRLLTRGNLHRS